MDMQELDDHTAGMLLKIATKISNQIWAMLGFVIIAAFGSGFFFATIDQRLTNIEARVELLPPEWLLRSTQREHDILHAEDMRLQEQLYLLQRLGPAEGR